MRHLFLRGAMNDISIYFFQNFQKKNLPLFTKTHIMLIFSELKFSFYRTSYMKNVLLLQCTISLIQ